MPPVTPGGRAIGAFGMPAGAGQPWESGLQPAASQGKPISFGADKNDGNADICPIQVGFADPACTV